MSVVPARVFVAVSARMASSRYPGKALVPLAGRPLLAVLLERMAAARGIDGVVLATSTSPENDALALLAEENGFAVFRGDEEDVLRRHVECARSVGAEHVVEHLVALHRRERADYTYVPGDALLMGILSEVVSLSALERSWERGEARHRSELVTLYVKEHPEEFHVVTGTLPEGLYRPEYRLTVDEAEDVALVREIFARLAAPGRLVSAGDAIALLDREPGLARMNAHLSHKPANLRSVALDAGIVGRRG